MQYVALLSGGKDSCFNLLHCAKNGHELIAAASLGPGIDKDEIDSYLYQTVGQDAIQLVADALEIPLFRRVITGKALHLGAEYGSPLACGTQGVQGDETEDLFELLSEVKATFPDVRAVSVGAILSNYQRVRVEHVCHRLSLTPLCYLWQMNQSELLAEMIDNGLEAIFIKVAGIGLTPKHLGKTLVEMQPMLMKLHSMYGAHICGEGGEYESFTLDLPLFKHRIVLEDVETIIHSDNDFATVAYLKVKRASLERKSVASLVVSPIPTPPLLCGVDECVSQAVLNATSDLTPIPHTTVPDVYQYWKNAVTMPFSRKNGPLVAISNVEARITIYSLSIEDEVRSCFKDIKDGLALHALNLSHVANITLLISSMDLFPEVNRIYASFFGSSPPARACVAVDLPSPIRIRLECIAYADSPSHKRQSLHVQSLSYWAPANIGPYSQAITVGERVFISGQIGLIPSSNTLPAPQSLPQEVALSIRHVRSIANVVKHSLAASWDGVMQGVISWLGSATNLVAVQCGMAASEAFRRGIVPTLFITVKSLPKDALVENQVLLHTTRKESSTEDFYDLKTSTPVFSTGQLPGLCAQWEASYFVDIDAFFIIVTSVNHDDEDKLANELASVAKLQRFWQTTVSVRLFHSPKAAPDLLRIFHRLFGSKNNMPVIAIPSRAIATWAKDNWDYALCFTG